MPEREAKDMLTHDGASERGRESGRNRRAFLAACGGMAAGAVGAAGCLGASDRLLVLSAGSLAVALEERVGPAFESETDVGYGGEYHGSTVAMRMVEEGTKHPDVVISADVDLLRDRLVPEYATWDVAFAANEVGVAYAPDTDLGARLEDGEPWYEVFADADEGEVAISDPDLDPLGYRAAHLFELAARRHDLTGFRDAMLERAFREPDEAQLLAGVEAGNRACAIAYENMAVDHEIAFLAVSDAYNFGNPDYADAYAEARYTTDEGDTVAGSPAVYNATVVDDADSPEAGRRFVRFLLERPSSLAGHGLRVDDTFPRAAGDVPEGIVP